MTKEQLDELARVTKDGTPWYVFAVHAFPLVPRLLRERQVLLTALRESEGCCGQRACVEMRHSAITEAES